MTSQRVKTIVAIATVVCALGCKGQDDEYAPSVAPKTYSFEGKVEPKFVGDWVSADKNSTIDIQKDGGVKIETVSRSLLGKSDVNVSGQWLAEGDNLMFQYKDKTQTPIVLKYTATVNGSDLTLLQAGGRIKTTYRRK